MEKYEQLKRIQTLGLPTPGFQAVAYETYRRGAFDQSNLRFPVAVRSSYHSEDGEQRSHAGQFKTVLNVMEEELEQALGEAFNAYPRAEGSRVIVQEMVDAEYSGVLFAYHTGVWKVELTEGLGENLVSGRRTPKTFLLPRFQGPDRFFSTLFNFWQGPAPGKNKLKQALIHLSDAAGQLLENLRPTHGLDIEFAIRGRRLYLLQARPVTTPADLEVVLTSANHKEILPPEPSRLMTSIIVSAGPALFDYYRSLDKTLPPHSFIHQAAGMPWINLSALLDVMLHWGLPTSLVCRSVGAEDPYRVGPRPWRALRKIPVFVKVLLQQRRIKKNIHAWLEHMPGALEARRRKRSRLWEQKPRKAFAEWREDFSTLYIELVTHMQTLTGSMSGPVGLLNRLGWLGKLSAGARRKSKTSDYQEAYRQLRMGARTREDFLQRFGHRGFYESDLGQRRFAEYDEADWAALLRTTSAPVSIQTSRKGAPLLSFLFSWVLELIHLREELRHETMRWFFDFRRELQAAGRQLELYPWNFNWQDLSAVIRSDAPAESFQYEEPSGWDMNAFLFNQVGRRLPLSVLENVNAIAEARSIGIYPGKVTGQVWRVASADIKRVGKPPFDRTILVADALDPGWVPFFTEVDGVIAYVGGLLSHASIVLRETRIPSITQLPGHIKLKTGEWIEMDGRTGLVRKLASDQSAQSAVK